MFRRGSISLVADVDLASSGRCDSPGVFVLPLLFNVSGKLVEHYLHGKGWMSAHLYGDVTPLPINDMKIIMIHIWVRRFPFQMWDAIVGSLHSVHACGRRMAMDEGNPLLLGKGVYSPAETASHPLQMILVERFI